MHVSYITPAIMYVTIEPNKQECWVMLHWISGHVCSSYIRPVCISVLLHLTSCPGIIATGSADIFIITHVLLCDTGPVHVSETKQLCLCQLRKTSRPVAVPMF